MYNLKHELLWDYTEQRWELYVVSDKTRVYFNHIEPTIDADRYELWRGGLVAGFMVIQSEDDVLTLLDPDEPVIE